MDRQTFFAWRREPFRQAAVGAARFIFPDIVGPIEPPGAYNDELPPALRSRARTNSKHQPSGPSNCA
jgi:hypothetical protein